LPAWISTRESSAPSQGTHNVFIERLWRSLKYECVYLYAFETGSELRAGLGKWIGYYNAGRPHSSLGGQTPDEAYRVDQMERFAA